MALRRGPARPWIANTFLVVCAISFSVCGATLSEALDVRTRGQVLAEDLHRYVAAPCRGGYVSATPATRLLEKQERYRPTITCTFTVDGVSHEATSEFNLLARYRSESDAVARGERWLAQHQPLSAYYDPLVPAHATLARDIDYQVGSDIVFSIGGIAIALGLWFAIVRKVYLRLRAWREARRRPPDEPIPSARVV